MIMTGNMLRGGTTVRFVGILYGRTSLVVAGAASSLVQDVAIRDSEDGEAKDWHWRTSRQV